MVYKARENSDCLLATFLIELFRYIQIHFCNTDCDRSWSYGLINPGGKAGDVHLMGNVLIIKRIFQAVTMQAKRGRGSAFPSKNNGLLKPSQHLQLCLLLSPLGSRISACRGWKSGGVCSSPGSTITSFELIFYLFNIYLMSTYNVAGTVLHAEDTVCTRQFCFLPSQNLESNGKKNKHTKE